MNELSSETSSPGLDPTQGAVGTPSVVSVPMADEFDVIAFRKTEEGKRLVAWVGSEYERCRSAKTQKQSQWYTNMSFVFGHQWIEKLSKSAAGGLADKLATKTLPKYVQKRTVNRIRSFVRTEQSKFLSTLPSVNAVPSTAEEEDIRSAYAAEQVIENYRSKRHLRREYSKAVWWMIVTGNGFVKTWWDNGMKDRTSGQMGDIAYRSVMPFHIFVPDLREREIDDQPYIIQAQAKPLAWAKEFWKDELKDVELAASQTSANSLLDDAYFNLSNTPKSELDSVVIKEVWVKPGTHKQLPNGGLLVLVEDVLVGAFLDGMPYKHEQFPYSKIEHLSNDSFFADSPIVDLIPLQQEINEVRTQIGVSAKRMGNPQLLAQQGSIVPGRMTNEPGQIIQYRPGSPPPAPMPLQPIPEYVLQQVDRALMDFEDLSGQHEISKGQAPAGVEAGTALAFLKESDDQYLTPQYQNIEDAFERIAIQTLELFQQFVDVRRKIKVIGEDGSYDTALLSGADIIGGTDIRVEPGSSIGQSQAAKRATVMDMFATGILTDPNQALRLMELGGAQKVLDTVAVAEKKALRENMKMKALRDPVKLQEYAERMQGEVLKAASGMVEDVNASYAVDPQTGQPAVDPATGMASEPLGVEQLIQDPEFVQMVMGMIPPVVPADDFDMHAIHIDVHNRYRMGQEYEGLPDPVKAEFDKHVQMHEQMLGQQMMQQAQAAGMIPEPGADAGPPGAPDGPAGGPGTMSAPAPQPGQ